MGDLVLTLEKYLETYSLEEILELNDMTEVEALRVLVEAGTIQLPYIKPVDVDA